LGEDVFLPCGWRNSYAFLTAWDAPRIRQIVGKHLVADVTVTDGFSQVVKIYRRNGGVFTRTPGVAVNTSELTLLRTLTIGNPSSLTGLGSGPEHLRINDDTGTDLDISLVGMSNYWGDWELKLTRSEDSQILWREFWKSDHTTNDITISWQNWLIPHYSITMTMDSADAGTLTGLPGPCNVWPQTPESYTSGDVSVTWTTTSTGRVTHMTGEPDRTETWRPLSGFSNDPPGAPRIPVKVEKGLWKAEFSLPDAGILKTEISLNSGGWSRCGTTWEEWIGNGASGESVKLHSAPDGLVTAMDSSAVSWVRTDFGGLDGADGSLPWEVRRSIASDNSGTLITLNPSENGGLETITETGGFESEDGTTMSRGIRKTWSRDGYGYPIEASGQVFSGETSVDTGSATWSSDNRTDWGAPTGVTYSPSGKSESWTYADDNLNLASRTNALGLTTVLSDYDAFDRPNAVSFNGITANHTFNGFSTSTSFAGTDITGVTESSTTRDPLGRLLTSNSTWNDLSDNITLNHGSDTLDVTRAHGLFGNHHSSLRQADGSLASASGPTLAFGGLGGDALTVDETGLLVSKVKLAGLESRYQTTWTDAWGRVLKTESPSKAGGTAKDTTAYSYSAPSSTTKRVMTVDAAGRHMIEETEPWADAGIIVRSGIDTNCDGSLGTNDRYVESVTTIDTGKIITAVSRNEDTGLREILHVETYPATNTTVTTTDAGEETLTTTTNYTSRTVTTVSSKDWTGTESFNQLGLKDGSNLSGSGLAATELGSAWRADGSLASVSMTIGGVAHSATFNKNGTLATLTAPGKGDILGTHSVDGSKETLTLNGITTEQSLDGTTLGIHGADVMEQDRSTAIADGGFAEAITPTTGSATIRNYNAAGAKTTHQYAAGPEIASSWLPGGLLDTQSLARGGNISCNYSDDGARDLLGITWPAVSSTGLGEFYATTANFAYCKEGQVKTIIDPSGSRSLAYENGRLSCTNYTAGPLNSYQIVRHHDNAGRLDLITLKRDGQPIHVISFGHTGDGDEISNVYSGSNFSAILDRDAARNVSTITRPSVIQTWTRDNIGRITYAGSNISGAPTFAYTAFDGKDRRLNCTTGGGTWNYAYTTAGQLTSASHPMLGNFNYGFDGIGRRAGNTANDLNQFLNQTNSQTKNLLVSADPAAHVWVNDVEVQNFNGSVTYSVASPGIYGGWVPWHVLAVLTGEGEGTYKPNQLYNPLANPDAKAEQNGSVWVPPASESFTFDADGNRESSALWNYGWNGRNKLVRSATKNYKNSTVPQGYDITYDYDAEGRRFRKNIDVYQYGSVVSQDRVTFVWDGPDLIYERHQLPSGLTTLERKYVWGPDIANGNAGGAGGLMLIRETRGTTTTDLYPLYDGSGYVVALADSSGTLQAQYTYGLFGELIKSSGPLAQSNPWRYATKYFDVETGLYDFGQRYYDPVSGQWLSREPLGEDESLNLYAYCHNDPVNNVDVLGLAQVAVNSDHSLTDFGVALAEVAKSDPKAARSLLLAAQLQAEVSGSGIDKLIGHGSSDDARATSRGISDAVGRAFGDGRDEWLKVGNAAGLGAGATLWSTELPGKDSVASRIFDMASPSLAAARQQTGAARNDSPGHFTAGEIALEASYLIPRLGVGIFNALALPRVTTGQEVVFNGWTSRPSLNEVSTTHRYSEAALTLVPMLKLEGAVAESTSNIVYRVIRADENPMLGLFAKNPAAAYSVEGHIINGSRPGWASQFISTTRNVSVAQAWAAKTGNRVVAIDLSRIDGAIIDLSTEAGRNSFLRGITAKNFSAASSEVLIQGDVPAIAIKLFGQ